MPTISPMNFFAQGFAASGLQASRPGQMQSHLPAVPKGAAGETPKGAQAADEAGGATPTMT